MSCCSGVNLWLMVSKEPVAAPEIVSNPRESYPPSLAGLRDCVWRRQSCNRTGSGDAAVVSLLPVGDVHELVPLPIPTSG